MLVVQHLPARCGLAGLIYRHPVPLVHFL
jgi:hypothetical protein